MHSRRISATSKRLEKTALLAALLKRLNAEEVELTVAYLSGTMEEGLIFEAGRDVVLTEYPDAQHGFDTPLNVGAVITSTGAQTVRSCCSSSTPSTSSAACTL